MKVNDEAFTQNVINRAADILVDMFGTIEDVGGPIGDKVSNEKQMLAYMQYKGMNFDEQAQIRMAMDAEWGPGESVKWERAMESRYQRSVRQRVLPFEEVL